MTLSEQILNYMEIAKHDQNSLTVYGALQSFLPEIVKLEEEIKKLELSNVDFVKQIDEYENLLSQHSQCSHINECDLPKGDACFMGHNTCYRY